MADLEGRGGMPSFPIIDTFDGDILDILTHEPGILRWNLEGEGKVKGHCQEDIATPAPMNMSD